MTAHAVHHGRLRAALLILGLALCLLVWLPGVEIRLACLLVGLLALAYLGRVCLPWRSGERAESNPESSLDASRDILISAGHDLRQPVQAISLFAASLAAYPLPESSRKLVAGIETGVQSLSGMLEAVFGIAKLRAGRVDCALQALSLEDFFARVVEDKLDLAHERSLHLRHAHTRRRVFADPALFPQALSCLLVCALVQSEKDGGILLGCRVRGDQIWVELRHTSSKVRQAAHVAEFIPGEDYCDSLPDKGYGLAYAQGLAQLMGGRLEVFAWPQRGSLLRLRLQAA